MSSSLYPESNTNGWGRPFIKALVRSVAVQNAYRRIRSIGVLFKQLLLV